LVHIRVLYALEKFTVLNEVMSYIFIYNWYKFFGLLLASLTEAAKNSSQSYFFYVNYDFIFIKN